MRQHTWFRAKLVSAGATPLLLATLAFVRTASAQDPTSLPPVVVHADGQKVKISGVSKGKGFQGTIKRHNFSRGPASHG